MFKHNSVEGIYNRSKLNLPFDCVCIWGKVMFLHLSVILLTGGGGGLSGGGERDRPNPHQDVDPSDAELLPPPRSLISYRPQTKLWEGNVFTGFVFVFREISK